MPSTYFALILFTFMFVLIDSGSNYLNKYINQWYRNHQKNYRKEEEKKNKASKSVIKRKVAPFKSKYRLN